MSRVIAFANQKGGVAKTTTTLSIGAALQERGRDVLLVDLDPQGALTYSLGYDPDGIEETVNDVLVRHLPIEKVVVAGTPDLVPANIDLAGADAVLLTKTGREYALERALRDVANSSRLHSDRLPSLSGHPHDQRPHRCLGGVDPAAGRGPLPPRRGPAARDHRRHQALHESRSQGLRPHSDDVRPPHPPRQRSAVGRFISLRSRGFAAAGAQVDPLRRSKPLGKTDNRVRAFASGG